MTVRVEHIGAATLYLCLTPEEDAADSLLSYNAAVMAIGERVKAGAPVPEFMLSRKATP